jgi:hypothetical protein
MYTRLSLETGIDMDYEQIGSYPATRSRFKRLRGLNLIQAIRKHIATNVQAETHILDRVVDFLSEGSVTYKMTSLPTFIVHLFNTVHSNAELESLHAREHFKASLS